MVCAASWSDDGTDENRIGGGERDFVDAVAGVDDAPEADAELGHGSGDNVELGGRVDAHDLGGGVGRIGEGSGEIEDGAEAERAANRAERAS